MIKKGTGRGEGLEQRGNVWIRRGGGSSAMTISLEGLLEGARYQRLYTYRQNRKSITVRNMMKNINAWKSSHN